MKQPNQYALQTERLKASAALPKWLLKRYQDSAAWTELLHQTLAAHFGHLTPAALRSCQVVHMIGSTLLIATPSQALAAHLRHTRSQLLVDLQAHEVFSHVKKIDIAAIDWILPESVLSAPN